MNNCTKENCPMQKGIKCDLEECPYKTSADVVAVVRCKDCKKFKNGICYDENGLVVAGNDDYCSYGERRKIKSLI